MTVTGTVAAAAAAGNAGQARPPAERFELGDWRVDPAANRLHHASEGELALEPRAMAVLLALCEHPGEVVSADALLVRCWGDALVEGGLGDNPVHKSINQLRRALGDSATAPRYIETIRKRGYRVIAPVRGGQGQARPGAWHGGSPFRGLQAFDTRHAEVFFGREQATQDLLRSVSQQLQRQHGLVLVLGPSGSGKTSLVSAGLIPALAREPLAGRWRLVSHSQLDLADLSVPLADEAADHASPFALALAAALLDWETVDGEPLLDGFNAHDLARALRETPAAVLAELRAAMARQSSGNQAFVLLFIDRLEALFRPPLGEDGPRAAALQLLQALAESGCVLVVAACRNDYYPQLAQHPWLMQDKALGGHLDLAPPSRAEIAQMVRLPARAAGLSFGIDPSTQQRLDDLLCDAAAASPDALPLLQYTLEQLYQQRSPHGELSFAAYQALGGATGGMGGLEGVIAEQAEQLIRGLTPVQQGALPHVLSLLVLVGEDESSPVGGRRALWSELRSAAERELVRALVDARLLVSEHSTEFAREEPAFRVAHEALLRRWPRVTDWIAQHRQDLQTRARLRQQAQRWEQGGRAAEFLWPRGRQLQEGLRLGSSAAVALSATEWQFLKTSEGRAALGKRLGWATFVLITLLAGVASWSAWRNAGLVQEIGRKNENSQALVSLVLGRVLDELRPDSRLAVLEGIGKQALEVLGSHSEEKLSAVVRLQRAKALSVVGEAAFGKRQMDTAQGALNEAWALLSVGEPAPEHAAGWVKIQGAVAYWQGQLALAEGRAAQARDWSLRYRDLMAERVSRAPGDREAWVELGYALTTLGNMELKSGRWNDAARLFAESSSWLQKALQAQPEDAALAANWAHTLGYQASVARIQGQMNEALARCNQMVSVLRGLVRAGGNDLQLKYRLGKAQRVRYWVLADMRRDREAAEALAEALELARLLAGRDPENVEWRAGQLWAELDALAFHVGRQPFQAALPPEQIPDMLERARPMLKAQPGILSRIQAAWTQLRAQLALQQGQIDAAEALISQAAQQWAERLQAQQNDPYLLNQLAQADLFRARLPARGDPAATLAWCTSAQARWNQVVQLGFGAAPLEAKLILGACDGKAPLPQDWSALVAHGYAPGGPARFHSTAKEKSL